MAKAPISLQDLRRSLYVKAKKRSQREESATIPEFRRNLRPSPPQDGVILNVVKDLRLFLPALQRHCFRIVHNSPGRTIPSCALHADEPAQAHLAVHH